MDAGRLHSIGIGLLTHYVAYRPLDDAPPLVHAISIGSLIISSGVFLSSLLDW